MDMDGKNVKQITSGLGYDGGAFFSPDGSKIVFRASRPTSEEEANEYKALLKEGLVAPTNMEIYICNIFCTSLVFTMTIFGISVLKSDHGYYYEVF